MKVLALAFALALSGSATLLTASPPSASTPSAALPPGGDPILEVFDDSLTTYLPSSATPVQDIRPLAIQRGVNLDGALRAGSTFPMAIGGNPFGTPWSGASAGSVALDTGVPTVFEVDLALPSAGLPWVIGRSYNSRQETSGASHRDSDGFQGANWLQTSQPEIVLHEHETDDLTGGGTSYTGLDAFNRVDRDQWTRNAGTAATFYDTETRYDASGNIVSAEDHVHSGFDVLYSIDDTDRLTRAHEGTLSGGSITSATRDQQWTLDHLGNWDLNQVDLDGNGNFTGTDEEDDDRTHNVVNELTARDIDDDGTDDYTLAYDEVGNLIDDGESYKYVWDAFGRMRKILDRSDDSLVAELRYNGLGFWIATHEDTDDDDDVDGSDLWYYQIHDEHWRALATFRSSDTSPKQEWIPHQAGEDGSGLSSHPDFVAWRDRDADTDWTAAADGVLEARNFYCQVSSGSVIAIADSTGSITEHCRHSTYGIPIGIPGGDYDSDGDCDQDDADSLTSLIGSASYDVTVDMNLDGVLDSTDSSVLATYHQGINSGYGVLTNLARNSRSWQGQPTFDGYDLGLARLRFMRPRLGRWLTRDPSGYEGGQNLYESLRSNPRLFIDPLGNVPILAPIGTWIARHAVKAVISGIATGTTITVLTPPGGGGRKGGGSSETIGGECFYEMPDSEANKGAGPVCKGWGIWKACASASATVSCNNPEFFTWTATITGSVDEGYFGKAETSISFTPTLCGVSFAVHYDLTPGAFYGQKSDAFHGIARCMALYGAKVIFTQSQTGGSL